MSSTDKTRDMLVNSMVKTKTGAQTNETTTAKTAAPATVKPAAKKKATVKKAPAKKTAARKPATSAQPAADPFQSRGRVWPD